MIRKPLKRDVFKFGNGPIKGFIEIEFFERDFGCSAFAFILSPGFSLSPSTRHEPGAPEREVVGVTVICATASVELPITVEKMAWVASRVMVDGSCKIKISGICELGDYTQFRDSGKLVLELSRV